MTAEAAQADRKSRHASMGFLKAVEPPKASAAAAPAGDAVAVASAVAGAPTTYPGDDAPKEQIAAWMAGLAEKRGLPAELPLMASLVESGMKNLNFGDADSVGFFQMRVGIWNQGEYAGYPDKPELQMKWFLDTAEQVKKARVAAGKPIDDPNSFGEWIADVERPAEQYRGRYQTKLAEAKGLLASRPAEVPAAAVPAGAPAAGAAVDVAAAASGGGGSSLGAASLKIAQSQLGVREVGTNTGPQVNEYLAAAKVAPGNPWCASFITWAMEKAGHKMPGGGWAAVQTWVRNAEQGNNGLKIVSADEARPGDIVAYDWGGQEDFGSDGHIGYLESTVKGGKFTALEGNNNDRVDRLERSMGSANVKFIRIEGNASPGAAQAVAPARRRAAGRRSRAVEADRPGAVRRRGRRHGRAAERRVARAAAEQERRARRRRHQGHQGRPDRPARDRRADQAQLRAQDHGLVHVLGPLPVHRRRLGLQSLLRARARHRRHRRRDRRPRKPTRARGRVRALDLDENYRPNEIGSPFAINGAGYFTDAAHQNHLHVGFKQAITPDWTPPADVAAAARAVAPAGAPVASAAAVAPRRGRGRGRPGAEEGLAGFLRAVTAEAAEADRKSRGGVPGVPEGGRAAAGERRRRAAAAAAPVTPAAPAADASAADAAAAAASAAPTTYPGDDAPKEQIAAWMAGMAKDRGLPPQLPIMAGLVESGLKNLNFGHADSVGFFQMRVGIWNQGAYAGYPDKPELQMKWFLDQAEAVKRQRLVAGKPVDDPNSFGEWIADVERPAEQYRGRYQLKLQEANGLLQSAAPAQPAAAAAAPAAAPAVPAADPAAAAASVAAVGNAKLPAEIAGPVQEAIAAGHSPGPEGAGRDPGGLEVPRDGLQVGRLDPTDRLRLLRPDAVVLRPVRGADPTRDLHADRGAERDGGRQPHRPRARRPDLLLQRRGRAPRRHVPRRRQVPARAAHRRRGQGVEPQRALLRAAVRGWATVRRERAGRRRARCRRAARRGTCRSRGRGRPHGGREGPGRRRPRRGRGPALRFRALHGGQGRGGRQAGGAQALADVPAGHRPVPGQEAARGGGRCRDAARACRARGRDARAACRACPAAAAPVPPEAPAAPVTPPPEAAGDVSVDLSNAATDYPGNDASQEELAKWLAKQAEKAGLPPELPVMAALVESGVKNLNFGDADSVGFFQMRLSYWDQGAYAGYPDKPELQAKWFIDQALALKRKRISQGLPDFGKDPAKWGEWIADVERPAEQYRGRYQLRLAEARKLLS